MNALAVGGHRDPDRPAARVADRRPAPGPVGSIATVMSSQPATDGSVSVTAASGSQ